MTAPPSTTPPAQRTEAEIDALRETYGLDYQVPHLLDAEQIVGIRGKRVLEAGGSLPAGLVMDELGAKQWIGIIEPDWRPNRSDISGSDGAEHPGLDESRRLGDVAGAEELEAHQILAGAVENIPESLAGHFDLIFSTAAFEHFLKFPAALERMYRALRPGGCLFAMIGPIWSAHDGHHLPPITDKSGVRMNFHSSPIPPWGHLLMRPPEMYRHLLTATDAETAQAMVYAVYHAPGINRLFTEDYVAHFKDSSFEVEELTTVWNIEVKQNVQKALEAAHPGRKHFANNGLRAILRRAE
ncbi:MAG: methyltransferase domain-containing protein [Rhodospirillaceae bacterium]|nr:methyltransferase domain-containing protein [Rhodospirillaceae bacterium]